MAFDVYRLLSTGDNQNASKHQVLFPAGIPTGGNTEEITLRMDQAFDPPEQGPNSYEIGWNGLKIPKTGSTDASTKEFTITVRIDSQWIVYDALEAWALKTFNPLDGTFGTESETRAPVHLQALDNTNSVVKTLVFDYAKLMKMKIESFDPLSEEPLRVSLTFIYGHFYTK